MDVKMGVFRPDYYRLTLSKLTSNPHEIWYVFSPDDMLVGGCLRAKGITHQPTITDSLDEILRDQLELVAYNKVPTKIRSKLGGLYLSTISHGVKG